MENKSLRFYAIMALWVLLFVLLFVSNRRVDLKTDINKSTSVSVSVEDTVSLSPSVVTTHAYSAGDDTYQAFFKILQNASCYQKFNQNARSYSHDYEAHSITLRFADGSSQNLLFTVYSDGVCQVKSSTRMSAPILTTTKRIPSPCALQTMPARTCSSPSIQTGSAR